MCKCGPEFTECIHLCKFTLLTLMFCLITCFMKNGTSLMLGVSRSRYSRYQTWKTELTNTHFPALNLCIQVFVHEASGLFTLQTTVVHTHFFSSSICVVFCFLAIQVVLQSLQSRVFGNFSLMFDHSDSTLCSYSIPRLHLCHSCFSSWLGLTHEQTWNPSVQSQTLTITLVQLYIPAINFPSASADFLADTPELGCRGEYTSI